MTAFSLRIDPRLFARRSMTSIQGRVEQGSIQRRSMIEPSRKTSASVNPLAYPTSRIVEKEYPSPFTVQVFLLERFWPTSLHAPINFRLRKHIMDDIRFREIDVIRCTSSELSLYEASSNICSAVCDLRQSGPGWRKPRTSLAGRPTQVERQPESRPLPWVLYLPKQHKG